MSLTNDITGTAGYRAPGAALSANTTGQQPGGPNAAQSLQARFTGVFQKTFSSSMATVFERGVAGEFDDPTLRLQEQAAIERIRLAQQADSTGSNAGPDAGANAGPDAGAVTGGGGTAIAEQRELYALRVRQSEARLANISSTLVRDFPKAAQLSSASTGTWDPSTFEPRTRGEVEAFAHRMVIDATESAARLEIVKTQLDAARFEADNGGGVAAQQQVANLEADYDRQKAYVDKLTTIVDEQSDGQVTDAGVDALAGETLRTEGDIPIEELADELREAGMDEDQVRRVIGATELGVEQEQTPGGSPRLKQIAADMTAALMANFNRVHERHREEFQRQEQERADDNRSVQKRISEDRQEARAAQKTQQRRAETQQSQEQHAAERAAEFDSWLATLAAASQQQRRAS